MSAFVVSRQHIEVLTNALLDYGIVPVGEDWQETEITLGQELWNENIASVLSRYPDCTIDDMPGPCDETFAYERAPAAHILPYLRDGWALLSLKRCYCYQSCEHPGWETSRAYRLMELLEECVRTALCLDPKRGLSSYPEWSKTPWGI